MMNKEEQALSCVIEELINQGVKTKLNKELNILIQALTPPTEQEVCDELESLFWERVSFSKKRKLFHTETRNLIQLTKKGRIKLYYDFSPKMNIMLGRFYEGKVK